MIQNINIGGRINKGEYQYTLQSSDTEALYRVAPELREKIAQLPGLLDVNTDLYVTNPQMMIEVDREKAAVYGITVDQVRQELFNAFGSAPGRDDLHARPTTTRSSWRPSPSSARPVKLASIFVKTTGAGTGASRSARSDAEPGAGIAGSGTPSGSRSRSRR